MEEIEELSYTVSHDLRAPLRAVDGFAQIILNDHAAALPPDVTTRLRRIQENGLRMGRLVDDLLEFIRLGRRPFNRQAAPMRDLARQALAAMAAADGPGRVEVILGDLPPCQGDPTLLRLALTHLLDNALKFSRPRDPARVEVGWRDGAYFVRDNGVGFDMRYADKLFGVFQRLHPLDGFEGTGMGLAIVKRIIQRHGGRVWAEAEVDHGATFYFTLGGVSTKEAL